MVPFLIRNPFQIPPTSSVLRLFFWQHLYRQVTHKSPVIIHSPTFLEKITVWKWYFPLTWITCIFHHPLAFFFGGFPIPNEPRDVCACLFVPRWHDPNLSDRLLLRHRKPPSSPPHCPSGTERATKKKTALYDRDPAKWLILKGILKLIGILINGVIMVVE